MALTFGFYNAVDGDRKYQAAQFGEMWDGLITDGVYQNIDNGLKVVPGNGLSVYVKSGRAWFNNTWSSNTAEYPLELPYSSLLLSRIDAVVLEVDTRVAVRANSLKIISGEENLNPVKPSLVNDNGLFQYPLAYVTVPANASSVLAANIEDARGTSVCPWVSAKLEIISIANAFAQFEGQFEEWMDSLEDLADKSLLTSIKFQLDNLYASISGVESEANRLESLMNDIQANL